MSKSIRENIIVFHDNDADGFSGAWVAEKIFRKRAKYIPLVIRSGSSPLGIKNKKLYFIDVIFSEASMKRLMRDNYVVIIDHHKSHRDIIRKADDYAYDLNHSACVLAWKYFLPNKKIPKILLYVEGRDLWRWNLPYTREITTFMDLFDFNFKTWNDLARKIENTKTRREIVKQGKTLMDYEKKTC